MKNKMYLLNVLAFLMGLFACNNVIYLFKIGDTYINIEYVLAVITACVIFVKDSKKFLGAFKDINKYFKAFIIIMFLSVIPLIIVFKDSLGSITSFFNGMVLFFLCFCIYIDIVALKEKKDLFINGFKIGFILNIILSLIQYITYKNGNYFSLYNYFPQPAFQINSYYGMKNSLQMSTDTFNIYGYRAQGFFLETSYYMAFLISSAIVLFSITKFSFFKSIIIIIAIFTIIQTSSGNMIILFGTFILYYLLKYAKRGEKNTYKINIKKVFLIYIIFSLSLIFVISQRDIINDFFVNNNIINKIINNLETANIANEGNKERFDNMKKAMALTLKYPFGVGYNMSYTILGREYGNELNTIAAFNRLITIQLELGLLGTLAYIIYIYEIGIKLLLKSKSKYSLSVAISVLGIFVCQVGNGIGFSYPFVMFMFALANIELNCLIKKEGVLKDDKQ